MVNILSEHPCAWARKGLTKDQDASPFAEEKEKGWKRGNNEGLRR
jgi:hypothetical protein